MPAMDWEKLINATLLTAIFFAVICGAVGIVVGVMYLLTGEHMVRYVTIFAMALFVALTTFIYKNWL